MRKTFEEYLNEASSLHSTLKKHGFSHENTTSGSGGEEGRFYTKGKHEITTQKGWWQHRKDGKPFRQGKGPDELKKHLSSLKD